MQQSVMIFYTFKEFDGVF